MPAPTIVFDLDGTLIDTAPDLIQTLNLVFAREGLAPLHFEAGRNFVGSGAKAMIARALEAERRVFPPATVQRMFEEFIAHYRDHLTERSRSLSGTGRCTRRARSKKLSSCGMYQQARA